MIKFFLNEEVPPHISNLPSSYEHLEYSFVLGKTLFVRIPKCGSSSMFDGLDLLASSKRSNMKNVDFANVVNAVVINRNPFDRLFSCWADRVLRHRKIIPKELLKCRTADGYEEFVKKACSVSDQDADQHFRSQYTFLQGIPTTIPIVSFDLYEIEEEWDKLKELIDLTNFSGEEQQKIRGKFLNEFPHVKRSIKAPVRSGMKYRSEYFNDELIQLVSERYTKDLDMFSYTF